MKVICIDATPTEVPPQAMFILKQGEIYTVKKTFPYIRPDWIWYELEEQPFVGYACERFIPLSEIDETAFVKAEEQFQVIEEV